MHTVSRKSERLVNLTIALLATGRWLTKSELFASIDGYSGDIQAQERMFERDKEELRNLGIEIEVGTFDPLFEDEVGYRIRPEKYRLNLPNLTNIQLSLLSSAALSWNSAEIHTQATSALVKLNTLGFSTDLDELTIPTPVIANSDEKLQQVMDAIAIRKAVSFSYRNADYSLTERVIEPYGVGTKGGYWYVCGYDLDRKAIRLFRLDRCVTQMKEQGKANTYSVPSDFSMHQQLAARERSKSCTIALRLNRAQALRKYSTLIEADDEWEYFDFAYSDEAELIHDILWQRGDAKLLGPAELVAKLHSSLTQLVTIHG